MDAVHVFVRVVSTAFKFIHMEIIRKGNRVDGGKLGNGVNRET